MGKQEEVAPYRALLNWRTTIRPIRGRHVRVFEGGVGGLFGEFVLDDDVAVYMGKLRSVGMKKILL